MVRPTPATPPSAVPAPVPAPAPVPVPSVDSVESLETEPEPEAAAAAAAVWSPSVEYPASRNLDPLNRRGFLESCSCQRTSMLAST